jgi:outer membrane lipoprotein-sorting protein
MRAFFGILAAALVSLGLIAGTNASVAQDGKKGAPPPSNPVGAGGNPWAGTVTTEQGTLMSDAQVAAVKKVSAYFNELANLKGVFLQTDPDRAQSKGRFYVKRPGRFRFDYGAPSKKVIISDGKYLAIQDFDLNNEDIYELDNTPFRLLLSGEVDLLRDARILDAQESEDLIIVKLQDKSPDAPGRIALYLTKKPTLDLKEWVTTDAQGLDTRVEVSGLVKTEELDAGLFKRELLTLKKLQ